MQITLIQTEIEEAIRNYVNNQVNLKPGMRIDIELAATRGADGFKATIDIVREDSPVPEAVQEEAPAAAAEVSVPAATTAPATTRKAQTRVAKPDPAVAASPIPATAAEASTETTDATNPAAELIADAATTSAETAPAESTETRPATPGKSLFGGLSLPKNA
jgi:hypothetical protein